MKKRTKYTMVKDRLKDIWDNYDKTGDEMLAVARGACVMPVVEDLV